MSLCGKITVLIQKVILAASFTSVLLVCDLISNIQTASGTIFLYLSLPSKNGENSIELSAPIPWTVLSLAAMENGNGAAEVKTNLIKVAGANKDNN